MESALEPPAGTTPDFDGLYKVPPAQIGIRVVCLFLCAVSIAVRWYVRLVIVRQLDSSDAALLLSGYANILEIVYGPTMFFAKYAVLRQIEAIFFTHRRDSFAFKFVWTLIWANLMFYVAIMISFIFACMLREKIKNPELPGRCIDSNSSIIATGAINVVSDITILIIPLISVYRLQMPLKTKIGVAGVFAVGIFACIASIVRLYYSVEWTFTKDFTFAMEPVSSWALGEFTTVIIVACAPSFASLLRHFVRMGKDRRSRKSSYPLSDGSNSKLKHNSSRARTAIEDKTDYALEASRKHTNTI
ncbi:uncharacterized protein F4822DRAFT_428252 [Hypoxylon trugodes]|uniref:uncharacterized protein n=1 Tax=Hypoxylon trugodes TaxID=326681 RepID=UPI00219963BA|nr:uncharacterized protein F4822DRAFT_428252 [Hypoxylon trugodes]KAI1389911.1 hypothetical protein F4822DRAFT_428252 [Hypoxylon trugodes]